MKDTTKFSSAGDRLGIGISIFCAVHCLVLPFLITLLPFLDWPVLHHPLTEGITLLSALAVGLYTFSRGYIHLHGRLLPVLLFLPGILLMLLAHTLWHEQETWLKLIGLSFVVSAHMLNLQFGSQCHACEKEG